MVITPDSKVKLIKNPLKLDNNNELMFANATSQYNYFTSLPKLEFDSLTYVRKDGVLRIETDDNLTYEDLLEYNFCMYQNTHFDNKWFYAFITDITWVNPSLVDIKIETAYFQTWQFDLVYKDSFIEREHVNDDTIGLHTLDENLDADLTRQLSILESNFEALVSQIAILFEKSDRSLAEKINNEFEQVSENVQNILADKLEEFTDDCSIVEAFGFPVYVVMGDYKNIKITTAEDLKIAEIFAEES